DFWLLGLQILGIASILGSLNFFVTIVNLRAPGMRMMRMPVFCWMTMVTNILMLLAFPVITVALVLLMFDRQFGTHFYIPSGGGEDLQLDRHHVPGPPALHHVDAVRGGFHRHVHHWRPERRDARLAAGRPAAEQHLLHRGPLPLRAVRRGHPGPVRRHLLLVPQEH